MARVEARPTLQLACTECKERTYTTRKNKKNDPNRLELNKYCPRVGSTPSIGRPSRITSDTAGV